MRGQDWGENRDALATPPAFQITNSIWLLDAFTPNNGATRFLPGSHLTGRTAQVLADPSAPQPGEHLCTGAQGSCVVFSSHCFHGGTLNTTDTPRMAMHSAYARRKYEQQVNQQRALLPKTYARLSGTRVGRAAIAVLDVVDPATRPPIEPEEWSKL